MKHTSISYSEVVNIFDHPTYPGLDTCDSQLPLEGDLTSMIDIKVKGQTAVANEESLVVANVQMSSSVTL